MVTPPSLRVLALIEAYSITGPAKNLIEFARQARLADPELPPVEISIATFQRGRLDPPNAFVTGARQAGLTVDVIAERRRYDPTVFSQLRAIVADRRPHILQSHNGKSHFLVRLAGLGRRYPWVAFHHGYTDTDLKDRIYNQFDRWSLRAAHCVVTVCEAFGRRLERIGVPAGRIRIQRNIVPPFVPPAAEEVQNLRERLGIPAGAKVVLSVGRLSREKGHLDLVEATALLRRRQPGLLFRLVLVGEGPQRASLERRCAALGLNEWVVLAGHQADARPYYSMAAVLALPSHSEGSPNVLLEAMAAGVPVIATAVGGVPEMAVHEETALLVPRADMRAMAAGIERLLADEGRGRKLAEAARQVVASRHAPAAYRRSMVHLYQRVLTEAG